MPGKAKTQQSSGLRSIASELNCIDRRRKERKELSLDTHWVEMRRRRLDTRSLATRLNGYDVNELQRKGIAQLCFETAKRGMAML